MALMRYNLKEDITMKKALVLLLSAFMTVLAACSFFGNDKDLELPNGNGKETVNVVENEKEYITLYFTDDKALGLYAEKREIPKDKAQDAEFIITELLKGTTNDEFVDVIPEGTKLNSCTVLDGLCTVDLSQSFISKKGTANVQMSIYSVVNTLCLLDDVDSVKFLIDGEEVMIFGSYIFDEPFEADSTIIR